MIVQYLLRLSIILSLCFLMVGSPQTANGQLDNDLGSAAWLDVPKEHLEQPSTPGLAVLGELTQLTRRVSVATGGGQADRSSYDSTLSYDGSVLVFSSDATNLVPGNSWPRDIYYHQIDPIVTDIVTQSFDNQMADNGSYETAISDDGRYTVFCSFASNLVNNDNNGVTDVFLYDRLQRQTRRVSVSSNGTEANGRSCADDGSSGYGLSVSADGRYVAFSSRATNLVPGDTTNGDDVFVHDTQTGQTSRVSIASSGVQANSSSWNPIISADGRYVAFTSWATNLTPNYPPHGANVFVHDRLTGQTEYIPGGGLISASAISANGKRVVVRSGPALVANDTNNLWDVYVFDRSTRLFTLVSVSLSGVAGNGDSGLHGGGRGASISRDGMRVAFDSAASDLVINDTNGARDIFVYDLPTQTMTRASVSSNGNQANGLSTNPNLSGNGRYVAFESYAENLVDGDTNNWGDIFVRDLGSISSPIIMIASPSIVPANNSSNATINLSGVSPGRRVLFNSSLPGSTFSQRTGTVDSSGRRTTTLRSSTPGTAVITARDLTTGQTYPISTRVTFNATQGWTQPPPANTGPVGFTGIRAQHPLDGRYLQNVPVPNRVDVTIDWKGSAPGRVEFTLNGVVHSVTTSGTTASRSFDMGRDLRAGNNTLRIVAINAAGQRSQPWDFAPSSTSQPVWMTGLLTGGLASLPILATGGWNGQSGYEMGFHLPPYAFDILAPGFGVPDGETKLSWEFSGKLAYPLFCAGPLEGSLTLGAERGFRFLGTKIEGKLVGSVTAEPIGLCAWEIPHGTGTLKFEATRNIYRKPVIVMVAYFNATLGVFVERTIVLLNLQTLATKILGEFYIDGKARVEVQTDVAFRNSTPYFQFSNLSVGGGIGIEGGYRYEGQIAEIKVWAGANGMVRFSRAGPLAWPPTGNWTFHSITLTGEAGAKFRAGWFEREAKGSISWTYPRSSFAIPEGLHDVVVSDWRLISHISTEGYSVFQNQPTALQAFAPQPVQDAFFDLSTTSTVTSVLVSNVYTYTEPSLAVNPVNDTALLLWVHDDIAKAVGQSHEIAYSRWNGSAWSVPAMVTNDNRLDGAPQTAWAGNGLGVAVWQRLDDTLPISATFDITTAKKLEIATATFNPVANTWSPVALLTNNTALDMAPALARRADGGLLAVWRQNEAGLLSGDSAHPDRIMTARYNNGWTTPVVAVDNIPGLVDLAAGYGANAATIAYTRFITPTGSVTPTLQLFTSTWSGAAWSPPTQLTGDTLNHTNPRAVYTIGNQPLLIWQAGKELRLRNLATGSQATLSLPAAIGDIDEFRIVQDHTGNIAAVFTAQASQRDLYVAFYDQIHGLWGLPKTLTQDTWSEGYPTPALDATGRLLMAYSATEIVPITRTTTITSTGQMITYTLPLEGQTDLVTLSHVFARNLTLDDNDLAISDQHPAPGAMVTISATVRNTGDLALGGVSVAFYDGDPQAGGSLINTTTLPQPLAAGYTATLTTLYTIPTTGGGRAIHALADPQNQIAESNENDNEASLAAFGPDLALDNAAMDPWGDSDVGLVTWVQNIGTTASPTTTVAFYWETITGTLATTDVLPSIAAGAAYTLTTPWNHGNLPVGEYRLVSVVNPDTTGFYEVNTENNQAPLTLRVGPDLLVSPYYLWLTPTVASTAVITAAVYNVGNTPSPATTVSFFQGDPTVPGNLIFSRTVPALAPAGVAYLTGTWSNAPGGNQSVTVWIDPAQAIVETSRANNLASGMVTVQSNLAFKAMLPLILRTR